MKATTAGAISFGTTLAVGAALVALWLTGGMGYDVSVRLPKGRAVGTTGQDVPDKVEGKLERFDEFVSPDVVPHSSPDVTNAETMKQALATIRNAFPDLRFTLDDELAIDGKVIHRWTMSGTHQGELFGIPATGKGAVWTGISILRLSGGKIVEYWVQSDNMSMMMQLGVSPAQGG